MPPPKQKWKHDGQGKRHSQVTLADQIIVICYNCAESYMRGKKLCPTCGHPYDPEQAAKARIRSNKSYEDIALENARRDGTVTEVLQQLRVVKNGGMIGRGTQQR